MLVRLEVAGIYMKYKIEIGGEGGAFDREY